MTAVLLDDGRVLAVDKPAGVSLATSSRDGHGGPEAVTRLLHAAGLELPDPLPLLVHRLDAGTSGVVLLARDEATHRLLVRELQERRVGKLYRALVWGQPVPAAGTIAAPLARDRRDGRRMQVAPDGKPAVTAYRTLRRLGGLADLSVAPETGRTHQIRVHLASRGHPIVGDDLYGGATRWHGIRDARRRQAVAALRRPLLHAQVLSVPALGLEIEAPLPADYAGLLGLLG